MQKKVSFEQAAVRFQFTIFYFLFLIYDEYMLEKGLVQVYTGDGSGWYLREQSVLFFV